MLGRIFQRVFRASPFACGSSVLIGAEPCRSDEAAAENARFPVVSIVGDTCLTGGDARFGQGEPRVGRAIVAHEVSRTPEWLA